MYYTYSKVRYEAAVRLDVTCVCINLRKKFAHRSIHARNGKEIMEAHASVLDPVSDTCLP